MKNLNSKFAYWTINIILISLFITMFMCVLLSHTHIVHFSLGASLLALQNNPLIKHAETSIEKKDFLMQDVMNNKFKRAIRNKIISDKSRNFIFITLNYLFIADKN